MSAIQHQRKIQHLFWRAGFGATPQEIKKAFSKSIYQIAKDIVDENHPSTPLQEVPLERDFDYKNRKKELNNDSTSANVDRNTQLKALIKERRETIGNLNNAWFFRMGHETNGLREKMTFFWHNHFACKSRSALFLQQQNNTLRSKALGKFGDLLLAVSQDAAMLQFLNNQQNRKKSPNENFAREVMELFTLGRGHYSEKDIKEAARAFTGWGFNRDGEFVFRKFFHDEGVKTIFGKSGNFKGEEVIEMLLSNPQTAYFVCTKIYRYFVNERINENHVKAMAKRFFHSQYDIKDLMGFVFTSEWFYDSANIGTQIKSPIELLAGMQRSLGVEFEDKGAILYTQKILGQVLFNPPNVAGWPGGKSWIDSSSLLARMQLPRVLFRNERIDYNVKDSGDANEEVIKQKNKFVASVNWEVLCKPFLGVNENELGRVLASYLLQVPINDKTIHKLGEKIKGNDQTEIIQKWVVSLMSLPEYQLC